MKIISRRKFLKNGAMASLGAAIGSRTVLSAPMILTSSRTVPRTDAGTLVFRSYPVQKGRGPHLLDWAYASDTQWDAFHSNIQATHEGVTLSDTKGRQRFGVNVRYNVEGFGYIFNTADNEGEFYELPPAGKTVELNLDFELAKSRVARNRSRMERHQRNGWRPSRELRVLSDLSEELLADARRAETSETLRAQYAQRSLLQAMRASEMLELEKATYEISLRGYRKDFSVGCDARAYYEMHKDLFLDRFSELFNFATITFVPQTKREMEDFEPVEGRHQYGMRDLLLDDLHRRNITVEGRLLFWFHHWVTPDWLRKKTYSELLTYVERTTREVIGHYGDRLYAWEIVNELHDWANECLLTPEQTVELTRLACDVARSVAPGVHRMVNNCCPFAEYVQLKRYSGQDALYPQRTPLQFTRDLVDAGVDFTIVGQQMYFPYRDLQDTVMLIERYEQFGKRVQISEIGASSGPSERSVKLNTVPFPTEPFAWHRPWDEELQADWIEGVYTLACSKPYVEGAHWFDFVDPFFFIDNGGLLRSAEGEPKASVDRLRRLQSQWKTLPTGRGK